MKPYRLVILRAALFAAVLSGSIAEAAPPASRDAGISSPPGHTSTNAALDLRTPDLRSLPLLGEITDSAGSDQPEDIAVIGAPLPAEGTPDLHVSRAGIGSLYWALRHPPQALRIIFPIASDDESGLAEDVRVECVTFAPRGGDATCDRQPAPAGSTLFTRLW